MEYREQNKQQQQQQRKRLIDTDNKLIVTKGEGVGRLGEKGE